MAKGDIVVLVGAVTQSAADAFTALSFTTGLSGLDNKGYKLISVQAELPNYGNVAGIGNRELALSRATKAAMPFVSDDDVLFKVRQTVYNLNIGTQEIYNSFEDVLEADVLIIEPQIFVLLDTNLTGVANTVPFRLTMQETTVTDSQRISILQSRIN